MLVIIVVVTRLDVAVASLFARKLFRVKFALVLVLLGPVLITEVVRLAVALECALVFAFP
jgi:hypothetical protein